LVVIPTYQEGENIADLLSRLRAAVPSADVLVVDDDSPDGTADLAEATAREQGRIEVLRRTGQRGLGSAYRAGFAHGLERGYDVLVEMDADLSHDPSALPELLAAVENGADLVIGSRYAPGGSVPGWPRHRLLLSRAGNWYAAAALGIDLEDTTAGYRAYRSEILRKLDLDAMTTYGYGFQIEMAYAVLQAGGAVIEVPIVFRDRVRGQSKMNLAIIGEAIRLVTWWGVRDRVLLRSRRRAMERMAAAKSQGFR